jgi:uncharacterized protein YdaU (DUF1376 family)
MSNKVRRVDYAPDDYIAGVGGVLNAAEQGVYWMVCSLVMSQGGAIPNDDRRIAGLTRIRPAEARRIVEALLEKGKLELTDDGRLSQKRARTEVERSANRIQIAAENGAKGGRPSKKDEQNQPEPKADGSTAEKLTTNHQPPEPSSEGSIERPKPARRRSSYSAAFEDFWKAFPTDPNMSKVEAGKAFAALSDEDQQAAIASVPSFRSYCTNHPDYRPVHAVRYLNQRRFEGFNQAAVEVDSRTFVEQGSADWQALCRLRGVASIPSNEHNGKRGWWFKRDEVTAARARPLPTASSAEVH